MLFDEVRLRKRDQLIGMGINAYPYRYDTTAPISDVTACPEHFDKVSVAGRITAVRSHGKTAFADVTDHSGRIQAYLKKDTAAWDLFKLLDIGDLVGVSGRLFRTRSGELTIDLNGLTVLAKSIIPVPIGKITGEKTYFQVADPETKYRKRYLDWLTNPESRRRVVLRAQAIASIRRFMHEQGFLEVDTPTVEMIYGGAEARPFETSIHALDNQIAYLRISPELHLKRYVVGGFNKVYTICQNFRNEGIDRFHNPEFTMMEWYEAYTDYSCQMSRFETLVSEVTKDVLGTTIVNYQGTEIDLTPPWRRMTISESISRYVGFDIDSMSDDSLSRFCVERGLTLPHPFIRGNAVMMIFEQFVERNLIQPTFILDYPIEISPLTKVKRGNSSLVERFEPYIYGMEIGNAYSELTDPVEQHQRFLEQRECQKDNDFIHHPIDVDFIEALACGMPPTGGVGLGIDRFIMLLSNAPSIRDVIPFPMVKPKQVCQEVKL